jgi:hypothetical protein
MDFVLLIIGVEHVEGISLSILTTSPVRESAEAARERNTRKKSVITRTDIPSSLGS